MLKKCPECELQVSDKAISCPHCGYPLQNVPQRRTYNPNKRRRLPNGFGQITELKGRNLRKRFRAMVTTGKTPEGKPICKLLKPEAYFETYNDAYEALVEYNKNPYDLDVDITVEQLYTKWSEDYFKTLKTESSTRTIVSAWSYCSSVYGMRAKDLRARHVKGCMDDGYRVEYRGKKKGEKIFASASTKTRIKSMFNLMYDYALEHEIVTVNYARTFDISDDILEEQESSKRGHMPFTNDEISMLWENVDKTQYIDLILIQCYSGWRPQELGLIKLVDVDLDEWIFTGGMKTNAGIDRKVPIHSKIRHLVEKYYNEAVGLGSEYLFNCTDTSTHRSSLKFTYDKYQKRFSKIRDELRLNPEHRAHDPRMHFITTAKKYNVDEYAIKYMVGHKISDITEKIYTEREIEWLKTEIEKIK